MRSTHHCHGELGASRYVSDTDDNNDECVIERNLATRRLASYGLLLFVLLLVATPYYKNLIPDMILGKNIYDDLKRESTSSLRNRRNLESSTSSTSREKAQLYDYCRLVNETISTTEPLFGATTPVTTANTTYYNYYYETVQVSYIRSIGLDLLYLSRKEKQSEEGKEGTTTMDIVKKGQCDCKSICHHQTCHQDYIEQIDPESGLQSCTCLRQKLIYGSSNDDDDYYDDAMVQSNTRTPTTTMTTTAETVCDTNSYCSHDVDACVCKDGFKRKNDDNLLAGVDAGQCVDIDECVEYTNICNNKKLVCVNLIGSYECKSSTKKDDKEDVVSSNSTVNNATSNDAVTETESSCIDDGISCVPGSTCDQCCSGGAYTDNGYTCGGTCYPDETPCLYGIDCHYKCCSTGQYSYWYSKSNHTCGPPEPCYTDGTHCIPGLSCTHCCSANTTTTLPTEVVPNEEQQASHHSYTTTSDDGSYEMCGIGECYVDGTECNFYSTCTRCCSYTSNSSISNLEKIDLSQFIYYNETTQKHYCSEPRNDSQILKEQQEVSNATDEVLPVAADNDENEVDLLCLSDSTPCAAETDCWKCCNGAYEVESNDTNTSVATSFRCGSKCQNDGQHCTSTFFLPP